jgi:lipocalin-like protein
MAGRAPRSFVRLLVTVVLAGVLGVGILAITGGATAAQQPTLRQQIVGTWTLVSVVTNNVEAFGPNPVGVAMFDNNGHFVLVEMRRDLPKFASNNRNTGTPEENKAVVQGSIAQFGTYSISEAERVLTYHFEGSTFPNRNGADEKRVNLTVTADEWKYDNPTPSIGGAGHSVWKRAK